MPGQRSANDREGASTVVGHVYHVEVWPLRSAGARGSAPYSVKERPKLSHGAYVTWMRTEWARGLDRNRIGSGRKVLRRMGIMLPFP